MSQRWDYPTVFARVPEAKLTAGNRAVIAQVREAERHGKTPIKDQVAFLVDLIHRHGWRAFGSSPTEYRRWCDIASETK